MTTADLRDKALRDLGAFVHRTVVEDELAYAVRIDGRRPPRRRTVRRARPRLTAAGRRQAAAILGRRERQTQSSPRYDWSRTHARPRGGQVARVRRAEGDWPAPANVTDLYGTWTQAHADASAR
jgi:hypothetical protein